MNEDQYIWVSNTHTVTTGEEESKEKTIINCGIIEDKDIRVVKAKDGINLLVSIFIPEQIFKRLEGDMTLIPLLEVDREDLSPEILVAVDTKYRGAAIKIEEGKISNGLPALPKVVEK